VEADSVEEEQWLGSLSEEDLLVLALEREKSEMPLAQRCMLRGLVDVVGSMGTPEEGILNDRPVNNLERSRGYSGGC
jgi:hypothetical protein